MLRHLRRYTQGHEWIWPTANVNGNHTSQSPFLHSGDKLLTQTTRFQGLPFTFPILAFVSTLFLSFHSMNKNQVFGLPIMELLTHFGTTTPNCYTKMNEARQLLPNCCSVCSHVSQTSAGQGQRVITLDTDHCLRHILTNTAFWKTAVLPAQRQYLFKLLMAPVGNDPNLQKRIKTTEGAHV
jgi:hypothetical protein